MLTERRHFEEGNQNQIWMIAAVSGNRLMFICRKDNGLLGMGDEGNLRDLFVASFT